MESHLHLVILEDGSSPAGRCCPVGKWEAADPGPEGLVVHVAFSCHRDETVLSYRPSLPLLLCARTAQVSHKGSLLTLVTYQ